MKKLLGLSTAAIIMSTAGVVSAASNPFSDVPADSWAYDAVATLSADGVIDGYPDGTYKGGNTMTRFEMAQIVARAMAKTDIDKADKALVDKLAAEFAEELDNFGVRVAELEKKSDNVIFTGTARLRYDDGDINATNPNQRKGDDIASHAHIESWIKGKVNDDWTAIGQVETEYNMQTDSITAYNGKGFHVNKIYMEGPLFDGTLKAGRYGEFSSYGRIIDTEVASGFYEEVMKQAMENLFTEEPLTGLREYFDVWMVKAVSLNNAFNDDYVTKFGCTYDSSVSTEITGDNGLVEEYAKAVPELANDAALFDEALLIVILNAESYAGTTNVGLTSAAGPVLFPSVP